MSLDPALGLLFKSHPWHGVAIGPESPERVTVFIEIVPSDTVKYELDKESGFVPRTLCAGSVAALAEERTGRRDLVGDDVRRSQVDYRDRFAPVLGPHLGKG